MIGKLGEDEKVNWPGHLAEIVHAYNATWSTVMQYSPHCFMFGCRPRLSFNFYFPTFRSTEGPGRGTSTKHVNEYVVTVRDHLKTTLQEAQTQPMAEAQRQKQYYDWKIDAIGLKSGDLILVKADAFQGKRKIKDKWEDKYIGLWQISPQMKWKTSMEIHTSCIATSSSSLHQKMAFPYVWVSAKYGMDVPAPPQSSLLLVRVTTRQCHKKKMVWQSPSIRLGRLPWGG